MFNKTLYIFPLFIHNVNALFFFLVSWRVWLKDETTQKERSNGCSNRVRINAHSELLSKEQMVLVSILHQTNRTKRKVKAGKCRRSIIRKVYPLGHWRADLHSIMSAMCCGLGFLLVRSGVWKFKTGFHKLHLGSLSLYWEAEWILAPT